MPRRNHRLLQRNRELAPPFDGPPRPRPQSGWATFQKLAQSLDPRHARRNPVGYRTA
jgi:hypothetical protein